MQDNRINYVVVGAFVAAVLVAFVVVISMLAASSGPVDKYYTVYNNVGGVKLGTLVLYEGFNIGQVSRIEPQKHDNGVDFKVDVEVLKGWKIPADSIAHQEVAGLLSPVAIDIYRDKSKDVSGATNVTMLKPGSLIQGAEGGSLFTVLADASTKLMPLIDNLNAIIAQLGPTLAQHLPEIMSNLDKISASVQNSTSLIETDVLKPENRQHIDRMIAGADQTVANLRDLTKGLEQTRALLDQSMQKVDKIVDANSSNIDETTRDLRYTLDTISRYVDDIAHNADDTARNMAEFSRSIRDNPGLLLGGGNPPDRQSGKDGRK